MTPAEAGSEAGRSLFITVEEEQAGERLDRYLTSLFPEFTRSRLQKLIAAGAVEVRAASELCADGDAPKPGAWDPEACPALDGPDQTAGRTDAALSSTGERASAAGDRIADQAAADADRAAGDGPFSGTARRIKPGLALRTGDRVLVKLPPDEAPEIAAEDIPLDILYEDEDLLVVNKPKGMVVHPAPGHASGTLVNAVLYHCGSSLSGINGILRPGIVHRIDRDTTGSLIICKNDKAHRAIAAQLAEHSLTRVYHALVLGRMQAEQGTVEKPIGRSRTDRKRMAVVPEGEGKRAVTHYQVISYYPQDDITYLACRLETGRTHQIRVHLSSIGHPVLGDTVYGGEKKGRFAKLSGQCLHAKTLCFTHPRTGERIDTDAPLPAYFTELLDKLR